jgi:hypothetical protein
MCLYSVACIKRRGQRPSWRMTWGEVHNAEYGTSNGLIQKLNITISQAKQGCPKMSLQGLGVQTYNTLHTARRHFPEVTTATSLLYTVLKQFLWKVYAFSESYYLYHFSHVSGVRFAPLRKFPLPPCCYCWSQEVGRSMCFPSAQPLYEFSFKSVRLYKTSSFGAHTPTHREIACT